jgi:hypothetical protein
VVLVRAPAASRARSLGCVGQASVAASQRNAASSRATATATTPAGLRRSTCSRCQCWCSLRCARQAISMSRGSCPAWRRARVAPIGWAVAVLVSGLDQQPPGMAGAGFGDRSLAAGVAGGSLRRDDPEEAGYLGWPWEASEAADLGAQPGRRERVDPAEAPQPRDRLGVGGSGDRAVERGEQCLPASEGELDAGKVVGERCLSTGILEAEPANPDQAGTARSTFCPRRSAGRSAVGTSTAGGGPASDPRVDRRSPAPDRGSAHPRSKAPTRMTTRQRPAAATAAASPAGRS